MLEQVTPAPQLEPLPIEPDFVLTLFNDEIGPARVLVPEGASVEHIPYYLVDEQRYVVMVCIDDQCVGVHCGERVHRAITFIRKSDAERLCEVRNAARGSS